MFSSVPIKLLNEAKPFIVTIETKFGEKLRGKLINVEDNMNCILENSNIQENNGKHRKCPRIFIKGNIIKIIILPDILKDFQMVNSFS